MQVTNERNNAVISRVSASVYNLVALLSGLLFGAGLTISTMVDPARVIAFLDVFGAWEPTLAFVMMGGISVYMPLYWAFVKPKNKTVFGGSLHLPTKTDIDKPLIFGALLFGIGWGISGICPGPALTNITSGDLGIYAFILSMVIGMISASKMSKKLG
ncbi:hypothetical protein GMES_3459 [Paraglaciecola mesophila KMM 241]|uniref:YeeE/YedE family protein n=1 Tax=Paraglaciecola mesophila KMM 241 TaxID=1128912 RepID=K6YP22_9ALTE|nr:YeeE/YedE family protein [Paraglaciecola mesophila]GAC25736.1 hypothetical protein GMES_3459 [Paraglaciecola mesophila KMM 241]|tara:strand:+ start:5356 stop:5829 length:474 start_codon:yes stop_codon:yes gene_type:complete